MVEYTKRVTDYLSQIQLEAQSRQKESPLGSCDTGCDCNCDCDGVGCDCDE